MRLQKNINYNLLVTGVTENRKTFPREGVVNYVHDIYFSLDNDGGQSIGEYITTTPGQKYFRIGEKACFVVVYDAGKGVEIDACAMPESMKQSSSDMIERDFVKISGDSHNFAMAYAKDIYCARIAAGLAGFEPNVKKEIEEMKEMAYEINQWLVDPQKPLPF